MKGLIEGLYNQEFEKNARSMLANAEYSRRINIKETRNFIDFDLIPFIKSYLNTKANKGDVKDE